MFFFYIVRVMHYHSKVFFAKRYSFGCNFRFAPEQEVTFRALY